jgi:hypothetical protein
MNKREGKKIAVMAAVIMGFMVFAFMPLASAGVTSFTVTPNTGIAGAVQLYDAYVITDGVTSINITIPAGFIAVAPTTSGVEIARVNFWNSSTKAYYGHAIITANNANPTTEVDIYGELGGVVITTTQDVDYAAGAQNTFESPLGDGSSAIIKLPTEDDEGSIKITINSTAFQLDAVMTAIKQFVRNPTVAGEYTFYADGKVAPVNIHRQPLGDLAYLKKGPYGADDYDLSIYTAPTTIGQHGALIAADYWSPDGSTVAVATIDINGDGVDEIAYLKKGPYGDEDYDLYIYTAPTAIGEHDTLLATDYWSPDGNTVAIAAIGMDKIAYLKKGPYGADDYDLYIYTAPTTIRERGTLIASDCWSPDGDTRAITAVGGGDEIAYLKKGPYGDRDYDLHVYTAPTTIREHGTLIASDCWSPDGDTRAITAVGGGDEMAYLKKGPYGADDYDLYIYTAPTTIRERGTLIATDYWAPDGQTKDISALG